MKFVEPRHKRLVLFHPTKMLQEHCFFMCRQWETLGHVHADEEFDIADILDRIYCQGEWIYFLLFSISKL